MKAMILAAGLGTRLKPLTDSIPKALVRINGRTLLEMALNALKEAGCRDVVINVHHFPQQITEYLDHNNNFGINIALSDESDRLLDSGGGIRKAAWFFGDEAFMVYNVDVVTDMDLRSFMKYHLDGGALASLAVRKRETQRYLLFDNKMQLLGWKNIQSGAIRSYPGSNLEEAEMFAFSGIHIISPKIFSLMEEAGKFSIIDVYLRLASQQRILGYVSGEGFWADAGKPENLGVIENYLRKLNH